MKYVFMTGGVASSLGKGVTAAALGCLLKARGYRVSMQKLNLYYNAEPAFLSPLEHGEAFITEDGHAVDLDLGNYERLVDETLPGECCCTTGKIHRRLLERELRGDFHGMTIQAIPHVANEIKSYIEGAAECSGAQISIVDIGGTVGDMEASVYLEAIRQMRLERSDPYDCCYVHLTLMPYISTAGELKTKPTQSSVRALRSAGIQPDVIVCRTEKPMTGEAKEKIALFCNVKTANVIQNMDVDPLCRLPLVLEKEGLARAVLSELRLENAEPDLTALKSYVKSVDGAADPLRVALVGKYTAMPDAYLSVTEALRHACAQAGAKPRIDLVDAEKITPDTAEDLLGVYDAIVVPGGFGDRGVDGMIVAALCARAGRAFPGHGLWHAAGGGGSGAQPAGYRRRAYGRGGPADAPSRGTRAGGPRLPERQPRRHPHGKQRRAPAGWRIAAYLWGRCGARASFQPLRGGPGLRDRSGAQGPASGGRERGGGLSRGI